MEEEKDLIKNYKEKIETKEERKMLIPKVDIVFQSLFSKNNQEITKSFMEDLLEEKIDSIKINEDKELIRKRPEDKFGILDLQVDINNKEKVDVEVQLLNRDNFVRRILYYVTRLYSDQLRRGEPYSTAKRVVLIAIVDFELEEIKNIEGMESKWKIIETKNRKEILTELIEINIINLKKARQEYEKSKENKKAQWMMFLNNPESMEVKEIMGENKGIEKAIVTVKEMSEDEKMQRLADLRMKAIRDEADIRSAGYKDGKKEGIKEGEKLGLEQETKHIKNIAIKLLEKGMKVQDIVEITGLKENEVEELNSKMQK